VAAEILVARMSLVYVTGISGSGKSAVCTELQRRGQEAHDTDADGYAVWVDCRTGRATAAGARADERTPGWLERHEYCLVPARVEELASRAEGRLAFLCGVAANEHDVWHLFSRVIYLAVDEPTLRHRLDTRTTNDFGKSSHELEQILEWHRVGEDQYRAFGALVVDASRPLGDVVDDLVDVATATARPREPRHVV
jgi:gluconate kinase